MGLAQSKPTSTQQFNIVITNLKCMNISLKCKCDAMHEHLGSFTQNPSQKFHKNIINFEKTLKNFLKTKNLGLMRQMHEE